MTEYYIGQIFVETYPADAASWCNETGNKIEEIEPTQDGARRFQIQEIIITVEEKQTDARAVRDEYFAVYVDWYQSKPLLWEEMAESEKTDIENYREYLKHYTDAPEWWEKNPKTFEEWKADDAI